MIEYRCDNGPCSYRWYGPPGGRPFCVECKGGYGIPTGRGDKPIPRSSGKLTDGMWATLRKLKGKPDGVYLSDLDERTVNALVRRKLVRLAFVNVVTPKGRRMGIQQLVYLEGEGDGQASKSVGKADRPSRRRVVE